MRKHGRLHQLRMVITTLMFVWVALQAAPAAAQDVLVYDGEGAFNSGYTQFGTATGKAIITANVLPGDLSQFTCIVLPVNGMFDVAFSPATLAALNGYVNGGGRVLAIAENSGFFGAIPAMNGLAADLGASMLVVPANLDPGAASTNNIDASPFTAGVSEIRYSATSGVAVAVGSSAHSLVRTISGTTFIGIEQIGSGLLTLMGDSNVFDDSWGDAYTVFDNGVLAANICDRVSFENEVTIDVTNSLPGSYGCRARGKISVAVLSDPIFTDFDATTVDADSVRFGKTGTEAAEAHTDRDGKARRHIEDVNSDGALDMVFHFPFADTDFGCDDIPEGQQSADLPARLTGTTVDGAPIVGEDILRLVTGAPTK